MSFRVMSSAIEDICELLDSYNGRDKVVRLACYTCKLYGCLRQDKAWQAAGSKLSYARMMLRLFDDIPMMRHTYNYGLGRHESTTSAAFLGVLANVVDQAFLPVEKACFLQDVGVLHLSKEAAENLDTLSTVLWASSLCISLLQTIKSIQQLSWSRNCLQKSSENGGAEAKTNLDVRLTLQAITAGKLCLDITHAVSCLPEGWLWGERIGGTKFEARSGSSESMALVDEVCELLQSHTNRDKVVSLASYVLKLWGSTSQSKPLITASAKLAGARACMRLFDDAAALKVMLKYGRGKQDGPLWGAMGVSSSIFTLAYLQAEKAVFLIDSGILIVTKETDFRIRTAHKLFWSLSAFVGLIRSFRALHTSGQLLKSPRRTRCASARFTQASLTCTKLIMDVIHAVSWLPEGWLWGNQLTAQQMSAVATASSVLGLVMHYNGRRLV